jgi:hypothetical protein
VGAAGPPRDSLGITPDPIGRALAALGVCAATYKGDRYHQTGSGQIKVTVTPPGGTLRRRG